ncbi:zf-HC2 domain-containing protein [Actinokineospora auranticolor]|uniref:Putative zinc finger protein n=1 Tax=Actinokineospora auranticolor TaxID=155976 RepID=A0A2S6GC64_9PSEU|nr:zf-HC2 domain-containing protein [Actinokineospora auranticolor]PPK62196.1 putative zinc finger protein [Actinokineospora auranticolor]
MSTHEAPMLGAYALGALDEDERRAVDDHLAGCAACRAELAELEEVRDMAGELPAEALLHGPPEGGDLLLARTLRQVRTESAVRRNRGIAVAAVAAAAVAAAVLGTGVVIGRSTGDPQALPTPTATAAPTDTPEPGQVLQATDPRSGAQLTARLTPAEGWVRLNASVTGIPEGERCRVVVVGKDGIREQAGSWQVSAKGAASGTNLDGMALVDLSDVAGIEVVNTEGKVFVSARL